MSMQGNGSENVISGMPNANDEFQLAGRPNPKLQPVDLEALKQEIKQAAQSLGIDKIGFASADPFLTLKERLIAHREKGYESGFEEPDIEKRVHPELHLEGPRSIISIAVAYPSKLKERPASGRGRQRGTLSRSAWGQDYHHVLRDRLDRLQAFIVDRVPEARVESMVDTGALADRAVAERAGIGYSAKNCAIITPEFGSWVYLGEMITNLPFEPDKPVTEDCGDCTLCLDACPTGALVGPGQLNAQRCLSFITQTKGSVEDEFKKKLGNRLYGCDTCQTVCPKNKGKNWTHHPEFAADPEVAKPLLQPMLKLSNREFKEKFGTSAASWRGKKPLQRNAIIALGNYREKAAVTDLIEVLHGDVRPVIRETAAWALGEIGGAEADQALDKALQLEGEETVIQEIIKAKSKV